MPIHYLKSNQIDTKKWDEAIHKSYNGIVYAYSWYLDVVCDGWEALVEGDYELVMPLTKRKKFCVSYLFQPYFTQQLGVFSNNTLTCEKVNEFLEAIPPKFKLVEINLNKYNEAKSSDFECKNNVTYELDLIQPYDVLAKKFNSNTKRNIKKAAKNELTFIEGIDTTEMVDFYEKHVGAKLSIPTAETQRLKALISLGVYHKTGEVYGVYSASNQLVSAAFFIKSHNKSIFLLSISSEEGKELRAMFHLVDNYICNNAEKHLTLDFEGSNNPGIARFYAGFGAEPFTYQSARKNNLPWLLKKLKK